MKNLSSVFSRLTYLSRLLLTHLALVADDDDDDEQYDEDDDEDNLDNQDLLSIDYEAEERQRHTAEVSRQQRDLEDQLDALQQQQQQQQSKSQPPASKPVSAKAPATSLAAAASSSSSRVRPSAAAARAQVQCQTKPTAIPNTFIIPPKDTNKKIRFENERDLLSNHVFEKHSSLSTRILLA
jgi:hypothetical protein